MGGRRAGRALGAAVLAIGVALIGPLTAAVAEPPAYLTDPITDTAGALDTAGRAEVAAAQEELLSTQDVQLWVAYVTSFDGLTGQQWAAQSAATSGFGGNDMLFAVAVGDRAYGYDVAAEMPISEAQLETIMARDVEPQLRAGDWAGAAVALADGIQAAAGGGTGGSDGGGLLPWLVGAAVLVGGGLLVLRLVRRGRRAGTRPGSGADPAAAPGEPSIEELRQQVAALLIEVDDSIKTSEQELGFAVAQFGEDSVGAFTEALAQSRTDLARAFQLQRQAQQAQGTPEERGLLTEILRLCTAADTRLDEQVESFDRLRDLERTIDTVLPGLAQQVAALPARADAAAAVVVQLASRWPAAALDPLDRHMEQARERITFSEESVRVGSDLLAAGDRTGAVARARATEEAIGQAGTLLDFVERAPEILDTAQRAIDALVVETQKDLAEAERLGLPPEVAGTHRFAADTLTWAHQVIGAGNYDPIAVRRALEESDAALDAALVPLREAEARRQRAVALLASATDAARASIQAADDFITTRRGAVGAEARTRLAESKRRFEQGAAEPNPIAALEHMQAADALSDQANALAQQDEARTRNAQQRGGGDALGNIVLGGILIDAITRGGSGGGRSRGGGISFPSSSSRGPGSFGGSSTRARRSGGGRF